MEENTIKPPEPSTETDPEAELPLVQKAEFLDVEDETSTVSPLVRRVNNIKKRADQQALNRSNDKQNKDQHQLDLFVADLLDYNLKDDTATMEAPLFSLSTKPDLEQWRWTSADKKKWLEVTPSAIGRATIHDKDLLIYLASQLVAAMNTAAREGEKMPGRRIRFTAHDYLCATRKDTSGKGYASIEATIDRLSGTRLKTNIEMGNIDRRSSFGLIESANYDIETDSAGNKRMTSITVTLSEWFYRALEHKNILTISPLYFSLRKPLEKRLYELARKHVGEQAEWIIEENNLLEKTGSKSNIREFRRMLNAIIADDSIPEYRIEKIVSEITGKNQFRFYQKDVKKFALAYAKKKPIRPWRT